MVSPDPVGDGDPPEWLVPSRFTVAATLRPEASSSDGGRRPSGSRIPPVAGPVRGPEVFSESRFETRPGVGGGWAARDTAPA